MTGVKGPAGPSIKADPVDRQLSVLACGQHSLLTVEQLHGAGLCNSTISKRVKRGVLHREYRGVYSLAKPLSRPAQLLAPVLAAGPGAFLSHLTAAELHGLLRYLAKRIDVIAPRARRLPFYVHTYRRLHPLDVTDRDGIPVTSVARTLVDLTDLLDIDELANIIHEAAFRGSFSALATRDAMARAHGRRNLNKLEAALSLHERGSAGTKSASELALKRLITAAALPEPLANVHVEGVEVDLFWPEHRLCVEVDGHGHGRSRTRREDELKDRLLAAHGYAVLRVTGRSPDAAIARIANALAE